MTVEGQRVAGFGKLEDGLRQASPWYTWGPYVSERQWGTVREDYSEDGDAWGYLPHDHARSRAYRWGEDALAGFCDVEQRLCLGLALWNGRDPFLKERLFGLTGPEGNHGEDVKEHWWYLDAVPSHAWNRWRYHYPQGPFPYDELRLESSRRDRRNTEYEVLDTGIFDQDRYWIVEVRYAKTGDAAELLMSVTVTNAGPDADTVHVLPTAWFRNTWSWDHGGPKPVLRAADNGVVIEHPDLGALELLADDGPGGAAPVLLCCENETNTELLFGSGPGTPYPKDGINDHVVSGKPTVNPRLTGTKCSFWYQVTIQPGQTAEIRLWLRPGGTAATTGPFGENFGAVLAARQAEADEFYRALTPESATADEAMIMRQAFAGLLWSKQFYNYDVGRWLDGDPAQPAPPPDRALNRNARWRNFNAFDIMSMPDKWEYPWFAAWDMAFQCVGLAHIDPGFAKYQLVLLCREWFQHPNGALPAYEWDFGDVNPPVQAWAALEVFALDGCRDLDFLARIFDKLLVNFTWWVNREDMWGNNLFEGGFLGQGLADAAKLREQGLLRGAENDERLLLSVVGTDRLTILFRSLFDESRFLSRYGLRSLSAVHRDQPYVVHLEGTTATIGYEPAESTTGMFGGNSNWRGPIWFPLNYLVISCLLKYHKFFGDDFTVEYPAGSGERRKLSEIAGDLRDRLISIFTRDGDGRRPCFGWVDRLQDDPAWRDNLYFSEYFHGDNAAGLGASHQTGWTGLIADVIRRRHRAVPETVDLIGDLLYPKEQE